MEAELLALLDLVIEQASEKAMEQECLPEDIETISKTIEVIQDVYGVISIGD